METKKPMGGVAILMKSMGVDPEEIKGQVEAFASLVKGMAEQIRSAQNLNDAKQDQIFELLKTHMQLTEAKLDETLIRLNRIELVISALSLEGDRDAKASDHTGLDHLIAAVGEDAIVANLAGTGVAVEPSKLNGHYVEPASAEVLAWRMK